MNPFETFVAVTGLAATLIMAVYAAKTFHREPSPEEILPWEPDY